MNKIIIIALGLLYFSNLFAEDVSTPVISTEAPENSKTFNPRKGHWLMSLGLEEVTYHGDFYFPGDRRKITQKHQQFYGGRLGLGREFYLGAGFMTTTKVYGFYEGTAFNRIKSASPDVDDDFAYIKTSGQIWGGEASQSLSYLFDMKTKNPLVGGMTYLTVEPFIEFGLGRAQALSRVEYEFDASTREYYRESITDNLLTTNFGGGINMTSREGFFFFMKAMSSRITVTDQKRSGVYDYSATNPQNFKSSPKNVELSPLMFYSIGGGYKF